IDRPGRGSLWRHAEISLWKGTSMKRLLRSNRYRAETNVPASPTIPCIQPQIVSDSPVPRRDLGDRQRCRIALYSHDTMGLGHMRRNLLIAQTLACSSLPADILLIRGGIEAIGGELPPGVDCLTLPALYKESAGQYRARHLTLALQELIG